MTKRERILRNILVGLFVLSLGYYDVLSIMYLIEKPRTIEVKTNASGPIDTDAYPSEMTTEATLESFKYITVKMPEAPKVIKINGSFVIEEN